MGLEFSHAHRLASALVLSETSSVVPHVTTLRWAPSLGQGPRQDSSLLLRARFDEFDFDVHEAEVLQHTWMQIVRQKPEGFGDIVGDSGIDR